jgi:hypothetical protein
MNNAKFKLLCRALGQPRFYVRGLLEVMWDVAHECGNPVLGSPDAVEAAAEWPGEPGVFFAALRDGKWIDQRDDGQWEIHHYWHHAPDYARDRAGREAERWKEKLCEGCGGIFHSNDKRAKHCSDRCRVQKCRARQNETDGNASRQIHTVQKRIETDCNAPPAPAPAPITEASPYGEACSEPATPAAEPPPDPVVMSFLTNGPGPKEWHLHQSKVDEYKESFPGVDVLAECKKARQWCIDNPTNRRTAKGVPAFLGRWLTKEQNRGPRVGTDGHALTGKVTPETFFKNRGKSEHAGIQ